MGRDPGLRATLGEYRQRSRVLDDVPIRAPFRTVFIFAGQGCQWRTMGRGLLEDATFLAGLEACDEALRPGLGWSVLDEMRAASPRLDAPLVARPVTFAIQVALTAMLDAWGIEPDAVIGHSFGEVAAAHAAGLLSLDRAAHIVACQTRVMAQLLGRGRMLALLASIAELEPALRQCGDRVAIAARNGPRSTVLSGDASVLDALADQLGREGISGRFLPDDVAFHGPQLDPHMASLAGEIGAGELLAPRCRIYSCLHGGPARGEDFDARYWAEQLRRTVRFDLALESALAGRANVVVEIGPHPVLQRAIVEVTRESGEPPVLILDTLRRARPERLELLCTLGVLMRRGVAIDRGALADGDEALVVAMRPRGSAARDRYRALRGADSVRRRGRLLTYLGQVIGRGITDVDAPLALDSLTAVELINRIRLDLRVELSPSELLADATPASLLASVERELSRPRSEPGPTEVGRPNPGQPFALSVGQRGIWLRCQMAPTSSAYNLAFAARLRPDVDPARLRVALQRVLAAHAMLHATFELAGDQPVQRCGPPREVAVRELETDALESAIAAEADAPFELERGPPVRAVLWTRPGDPRPSALSLTVHHLVIDYWALDQLLAELEAAYLDDREIDPRSTELDYRGHVDAEQARLAGAHGRRLREFWHRQLPRRPPPLDLPSDRARPAILGQSCGVVSGALDPELAAGLTELAASCRTTLYVTMLAGFLAFVSRAAGQVDVAVASPVACRGASELEGVVAHFANTVVVRGDLSARPTVVEWIAEVRSSVLAALDHADYPYHLLSRELGDPVCQALFGFDEFFGEFRRGSTKLFSQVLLVAQRGTDYDIELRVDRRDGLHLSWKYSVELFERDTVERFHAGFVALLERMIAEPNIPVDRLPGPRFVPVHERIVAQARRAPTRTAVIAARETLTYAELDRRSDRLARHLSSLGVGPEVTVGVAVLRSPEMIVAVLAVLRAGGAFVPLDPDDPIAHTRARVRGASCRVVLASFGGPLDESCGCRVLDIDRPLASPPSSELAAVELAPLDLAYVMHTSGSTGAAKAVMVHHRGLLNYLSWAGAAYGPLTGDGGMPLLSPLTFDATITTLLLPLLEGRAITIVEPGRELDRLPALIRSPRGFGRIKLTPAHLQALAGQLTDGIAAEILIVGGDALQARHLRALPRSSQTRVFNEYGPTETVVGSCVFELGPAHAELDGDIPIGRAIANTRAYVLDAELELVVAGAVGELYLAGVGLARGYMGRPGLTAERFVPNPFEGPGARMYRTGDLARWRVDPELGEPQLVFVGRVDRQVKLRGFRVEPAEVEAALARHPEVEDCAVTVEGDHGDRNRLVAFVVAPASVSTVELRRHAEAWLPAHMVPASFVRLEQLPLTRHAKLDRAALVATPDARRSLAGEPLSPRTAVERALVELWREVLGIARVGIGDRFVDLGGDSLEAIRILAGVRDRLGVELGFRRFFEAQTIARQAAAIEADAGEADVGGAAARTAAPSGTASALSFGEERLWFASQLAPDSGAYNVALGLELRGELKPRALERALEALAARHPALRTVYVTDEDGRPRRRVHEPAPVRLALEHLRERDELDDLDDLDELDELDSLDELDERVADEAGRPFDLSAGCWRARLLRLADDRHLLLLTLHHIVSDAWSVDRLMAELAICYRAFARGTTPDLGPAPLDYAAFADAQRARLAGPRLDEQLEHWRSTLVDYRPLELPLDHPRPSAPRAPAGVLERRLAPGVLTGLRALAREREVTLFVTLLAALDVLLCRWLGQRDVAVGTPVTARDRPELDAVVGFFLNTLILRSRIGAEARFDELLAQVRDEVLAAFMHRDVPLERVVADLELPRVDGQASPFCVLFVFNGQPPRVPALDGLEVEALAIAPRFAKFDLTVTLTVSGAELTVAVEHDAEVLERSTADRLLRSFASLLDGIVADPRARIDELPILDRAQRDELLRRRPSAVEPGCVHELFAARAAEFPDAIAVIADGRAHRYGELDACARRLARVLRGRGVTADAAVLLLVEPSFEMLVAVLAILMAGGAYVPIAATLPAERIRVIIEDTPGSLVLADERLGSRLPAGLDRVVGLGAALDEAAGGPADGPTSAVGPDNLMYVLYTSGSTGRPKGVAVPHRVGSNLIRWQLRHGRVELDRRWLLYSPLSFDASFMDMFATWGAAGTLVVLPERLRADPPGLAAFVREHRIAQLNLPYVTLRALANYLDGGPGLESLASVVSTAEALQITPAIRRVFAAHPGLRLENQYGPTETHVVTALALEGGPARWPDRPAIGTPIFDTAVYLLDRNLQLVPIGAPGDLYIAGRALARGYLHRPDLTAERFVPCPFGEPGERMYRTGDRARRRHDGTLEYLGRSDDQIKLRGFRIEPGEVEANLVQHPAVAEAAVVRVEREPDPALVAFVRVSAPVGPRELRSFLAERLADYMIPALFRVVDELPRTANGKADRRALARSFADDRAGEQDLGDSRFWAPPRDPIERGLVAIWEQVLRVCPIGIRETFFDLGGHSLLAVQVVARCRRRLDVELPLAALFQNPTIEALAARIRGSERDVAWTPMVPFRVGGRKPALFMVHPVGGSVMPYRELARAMDPERPFYGIQAKGLVPRQDPHLSIEDMARCYVEAIRDVQPSGPLHIGGWSYGGLVAFEMARQLVERGEPVANLLILDSNANDLGPDDADSTMSHAATLVWFFKRQCSLRVEDLLQYTESEQLEFLLDQARKSQQFPIDTIDEFACVIAHLRRSTALRRAYVPPSRYRGPLTLIRAADAKLPAGATPDLGWGALANNPIEIVDTPGDHHDMGYPPNVDELAALIEACLE